MSGESYLPETATIKTVYATYRAVIVNVMNMMAESDPYATWKIIVEKFGFFPIEVKDSLAQQLLAFKEGAAKIVHPDPLEENNQRAEYCRAAGNIMSDLLQRSLEESGWLKEERPPRMSRRQIDEIKAAIAEVETVESEDAHSLVERTEKDQD